MSWGGGGLLFLYVVKVVYFIFNYVNFMFYS